jgi:hypothetical protein
MASSGGNQFGPSQGGQGRPGGTASPTGAGSGNGMAGAGPIDPQKMAAIEEFDRNSLRGNRESRALNPGQRLMMHQAMMQDAQGVGGGGVGGGGAGGGMRTVVTPGGGDQNAFSPQAATVSQVQQPGSDNSAALRALLAQMVGGGARKFSGTGDRGGYTTSGR